MALVWEQVVVEASDCVALGRWWAEALGWAAGEGRLVRREMIGIETVLSADEVLLTNSSWGVLPVVGVEREKIGGGEPGPVAKSLRSWWLEA